MSVWLRSGWLALFLGLFGLGALVGCGQYGTEGDNDSGVAESEVGFEADCGDDVDDDGDGATDCDDDDCEADPGCL